MPTIPRWVPPLPGPDTLNQQRAPRNVNVIGEGAVLPVIFGEQQVNGKVFAVDYDSGTDTWTVGVAWCVGPCNSVVQTYMNGAAPVGGVTVNNYTGTTSQTADGLLSAAITSYTDTLVISTPGGDMGVCYSAFQFTGTHYSNFPTFTAQIQGINNVQITGTPTFGYTNNPAHCLYEFITDDHYGLGESANFSSFDSVATDNDATVITEARRELDIVINSPLRGIEWVKILAAYASCWVYKEGDTWYAVSDRPRTQDVALTSANWAENSFSFATADRNSIPTQVEVIYTDTSETLYREREAIKNLAGVDAGSVPRRVSRVRMPGVTRYSQAEREANERLKKLQNWLSIGFDAFDEEIVRQVGDVIDITRGSLTNVDFRVTAPPQKLPNGLIRVEATEYDSTDYDNTEATAPTFGENNRFLGDGVQTGTGATVYYQATAPGTATDGDIWVDTDDDKMYVWDTGAWQEAQDDGIAQAIADAAGAQGTADNKVYVFAQADAPTDPQHPEGAMEEGDLWIETDANNQLYRWDNTGNQWVAYFQREADWSKVIDDDGNKPANNATLGATWDVDVTDQPADSAILNALQEWGDLQNKEHRVFAAANVNDWNVAFGSGPIPSGAISFHIRLDKTNNHVYVHVRTNSSAGLINCRFELEILGATINASSIVTDSLEAGVPSWQAGLINFGTDTGNIYAPNGILIEGTSWDTGAGTGHDGARFTLNSLTEDVEFRLRMLEYTRGSASDQSLITFGDTVGIYDDAHITIPLEFFFAARDGSGYDALLLTNGPAEAGATAGADWLTNLSNIPSDIVEVYYQASAPGSGNTGDLWIDSDDNKLYRWSGSWVEIQDDGISQAITDAAGAQGTADNKVYIFSQAAAPVNGDHPEGALEVGDLWIETDNNNLLYRWDTTWVQYEQHEADWSLILNKPPIAVTFAQAAPPTGAEGDLWIDTDDDMLYRHNGTIWVAYQDDDIATALSDAAGAQGTADNKIYFFAQTAAPVDGDHPEGNLEEGDLWVETDDNDELHRWDETGQQWVSYRQNEADWSLITSKPGNLVEVYFQSTSPGAANTGDLWVDSDDNKLYRYNGTWGEIQDDGISTAIADAAGAQGTADNKVYVFAQAAPPINGDHPEGALEVGDLWIETDDNDQLHRWDGTWVAYTVSADWSVITNKPTNLTEVYYQATAPGTGNTGDLWIDSDDNKLYRWNGSWGEIQDDGISQAITDAAGAQGTADNKIYVFAQALPPVGGDHPEGALEVGDLWIETDDNDELHRWSGSVWTPYTQNQADWSVITNKPTNLVEVYYQSASPGAANTGDLWIDSDDNKTYRYNGTWGEIQDDQIAQAITDAAGAQGTADNKVYVFAQAAPPVNGDHPEGALEVGDLWIETDNNDQLHRWDSTWTAYTVSADWSIITNKPSSLVEVYFQSTSPGAANTGDLWIDSDDNKLYRYNGTWGEIQDDGISQAITDAAGAQGTADNKVYIFAQAAPPIDGDHPEGNLEEGDLWIETDDSDELHRWDEGGQQWVAYTQDHADWPNITNKPALAVTYAQDAPPSGSEGDLWIETDNGDLLYRHNGTIWVEYQDDDIAQAITDAAGAQGTADNKVYIFAQANAPLDGDHPEGNLEEGDLWIETDNGNRLRRWNESGQSWDDAFQHEADWSQIIDDDTNKPEDNAEVNKGVGVNLIEPAGIDTWNEIYTDAYLLSKVTVTGGGAKTISSVSVFAAQSLLVQDVGTGAINIHLNGTTQTYDIPLKPSTRYIISGWIHVSTTKQSGNGMFWHLREQDHAFVTHVSGRKYLSSWTANTWTRFSSLVTTTANASLGQVILQSESGSHLSTTDIRVDGVMIEEAGTLDDNVQPSNFVRGTAVSDYGARLHDYQLVAPFGALNVNPNFSQTWYRNGGVGPAGWLGNTDNTKPTYENDRLREVASCPAGTVACNAAIRIEPNKKYEFVALVKTDSATMTDFQLRMESLQTTALESGKWYIASVSNSDGGQVRQRLHIDTQGSIGTTFTEVSHVFTPPDGTTWASFSMYSAAKNWLAEWAIVREYVEPPVIWEDDFGDGDVDRFKNQYVLASGTVPDGEVVMETTVDSGDKPPGNFNMQVGNNSGNDMGWYILKREHSVPIVKNQLYRITLYVRQSHGTSNTMYAGVTCFKGDVRSGGGSYVSTGGADTVSSSHYCLLSNATLSFSWTKYVAYVKQTGGAAGGNPLGGSAPFNDPSLPYILHADAEYMSPLVLFNYNGAAGVQEYGYWKIEEQSDPLPTQQPDLGGLIFNSHFTIVDRQRDRPVGWFIADTTEASALSYLSGTRNAASLEGVSDASIAMVSTAFQVQPGTTYRWRMRCRQTSGGTTSSYVRVGELDGDLGNAIMAIRRGPTTPAPTGIDTDQTAVSTRERTSVGHENVSLGTTWTDYTGTYTPTASAKWASFSILNWSATTGALEIARFTVEPETISEDHVIQGTIGQASHTTGSNTTISSDTYNYFVTTGYLQVDGGKAIVVCSGEAKTLNSSNDDGGCTFVLEVDTAGSWVARQTWNVGARCDSGSDVNWNIPIAAHYGASGIATQVRARIGAKRYNMGNGLKSTFITNPAITILGTKR